MWYEHCQVFFVMYINPFRLLKRVFDSKLTAPGYTRLWDVNKVLCYLGTIYKSEDLSLWDMTIKTVMVVSAQRDLQLFTSVS